MSSVVVVVDGNEYPVDLSPGAVTGEQVIALRSIGVTPETLAIVIATEDAGSTELPEVVALMALSLYQQDQPVDVAWLSRHLTAESTIQIRSVVPDALSVGSSLAAMASGNALG